MVASDEGKAIKVRVSFTDDGGNVEVLTSAATATVAKPPFTATFENVPEAHLGQNAFTFELQFSEEPDLSYITLRDHAFTLTNGDVTKAKRLERPSNIRWRIKVRPDSDAEVAITLPATTDCAGSGAVCTGDGRKLSSAVSATIPGPVQNSPATGAPTITGTVQVSETLTADTAGIADADGLNNATFSYQWVSNDGSSDTDMAGATNSTYTLAAADEGKTVKVKVSFTDDLGNDEVLTSAPTVSVAAAPTTDVTTLSITGNANPEYSENTTTSVATYTIEPAGSSVAWTLTGDDGAVFSITDGVLEFLSTPDYEDPADQDGDNKYEVEVVATDSSDTKARKPVTITVTDVLDPNVVLIVADDVGYEVFGANGSRQYSTPEIDDLAAGGVRFTNAHSKPCCAPSRVALMTGKSNVRNYVDQGLLPCNQYLIVDPFREAGYATAIVGKWRLHGFTRNNSGVAGGDGFDTYCLWGTANTTMDRYRNASVECDGEVTRIGTGKYSPDFFVDFLLDFMESNQNRPFFAYYPMVLAHSPYGPPPGGICQYGVDQCNYEEMVAYMDSNVGRIYDKLEELELLDNTFVVFTSDNGTPNMMASVSWEEKRSMGTEALPRSLARMRLCSSTFPEELGDE